MQLKAEGEIEEVEAGSLAMVWLAGAHASLPVLLALMCQKLAAHPQVQDRARREVRSAVNHHCEVAGDEQHLPYCSAVLRELKRDVEPTIDASHVVREDITYRGYKIPAGAAIILDNWSVNHDRRVFCDALEFKVRIPFPIRSALDTLTNPQISLNVIYIPFMQMTIFGFSDLGEFA